MEILNTLLDQLMKNIKQAPGWVPTVVACYFLPLKDIARLGIDVETNRVAIITFVALALFVAGDALDKVVFPRETENKENKGWKWLAPATLAELKIETRKHLNIDSGYYEVSKSLAVAAGR